MEGKRRGMGEAKMGKGRSGCEKRMHILSKLQLHKLIALAPTAGVDEEQEEGGLRKSKGERSEGRRGAAWSHMLRPPQVCPLPSLLTWKAMEGGTLRMKEAQARKRVREKQPVAKSMPQKASRRAEVTKPTCRGRREGGVSEGHGCLTFRCPAGLCLPPVCLFPFPPFPPHSP
jgi:hypothetical protein